MLCRVTCAACGSTPEQWAELVLKRLSERRRQEQEEAIIGACIAMSRFMTFVYMEADANGNRERAACHPHLATERRLWALGHVLERGMLRLEWPR